MDTGDVKEGGRKGGKERGREEKKKKKNKENGFSYLSLRRSA